MAVYRCRDRTGSGHRADGLAEAAQRQNEEDAADCDQGQKLRPDDADAGATIQARLGQRDECVVGAASMMLCTSSGILLRGVMPPDSICMINVPVYRAATRSGR